MCEHHREIGHPMRGVSPLFSFSVFSGPPLLLIFSARRLSTEPTFLLCTKEFLACCSGEIFTVGALAMPCARLWRSFSLELLSPGCRSRSYYGLVSLLYVEPLSDEDGHGGSLSVLCIVRATSWIPPPCVLSCSFSVLNPFAPPTSVFDLPLGPPQLPGRNGTRTPQKGSPSLHVLSTICPRRPFCLTLSVPSTTALVASSRTRGCFFPARVKPFL